MCRTTIVFELMKEDIFQINILASNYCLYHRNVFQNGVNPFSKIVDHFLPKSSKFWIFLTKRFCSNFTSMWSKYLSNNVWKKYRLPMSALVFSIGNIKCVIGKLISARNFELHYLICVWTTCWWNMNRILWKLFSTKLWSHLGRCSSSWINWWMLSYLFEDIHLSAFQTNY